MPESTEYSYMIFVGLREELLEYSSVTFTRTVIGFLELLTRFLILCSSPCILLFALGAIGKI